MMILNYIYRACCINKSQVPGHVGIIDTTTSFEPYSQISPLLYPLEYLGYTWDHNTVSGYTKTRIGNTGKPKDQSLDYFPQSQLCIMRDHFFYNLVTFKITNHFTSLSHLPSYQFFYSNFCGTSLKVFDGSINCKRCGVYNPANICKRGHECKKNKKITWLQLNSLSALMFEVQTMLTSAFMIETSFCLNIS